MTCPQLLSSSLASTGAQKLTQANTNSHIFRGAPTRSGDTWPNVWAFWHTLTEAQCSHSVLTKQHRASKTSQSVSTCTHVTDTGSPTHSLDLRHTKTPTQ